MFILKIIAKIAVNAAAIYIAAKFVDGVSLTIDGVNTAADIGALALIGFVIWLGNEIVRPIVKVLTFPLIIVTFGLFNIVINILILWGADIILPQLAIEGLVPLLWTTLILSVLNGLLFFI